MIRSLVAVSVAALPCSAVHRADQPIKVTTPGIELGDVHGVTIEGFVFDGAGTLTIPEAEATRVTRTTFNGDKPSSSLTVSADDVQVDHNTFSNRSNLGGVPADHRPRQ